MIELKKCPKCNVTLSLRIKTLDGRRVTLQDCACGFTTDPIPSRTFDDEEGRVKSPASK